MTLLASYVLVQTALKELIVVVQMFFGFIYSREGNFDSEILTVLPKFGISVIHGNLLMKQ